MAAPKGNVNARKGKHGRLLLGISGVLLDNVYASLAREGKLDPEPDEIRTVILGTLERNYGMRKGKQPMRYNSEQDAYTGVTSEGRTVQVEGVEWLESQRDGASDELLSDPDQWATLIGANQNVGYVD